MVLGKLIVHKQWIYLDFLKLRLVLKVFQTRSRHKENQHMHVLDMRPLLQERKDLLHIHIKFGSDYGNDLRVEHANMVLLLEDRTHAIHLLRVLIKHVFDT